MGMQFFSGRETEDDALFIPSAYRKTVRWIPQIGDLVPDFSADTTQGPIRFHDWADGKWIHFFSQPGPYTAVCATEMANFAAAQADFDQRDAKIIGLSRSTAEEQTAWARDIRKVFQVRVGFPMIEDMSGQLSRLFGMIHPHESTELAIRKSLVIDPSLRVRMITEYPNAVGRSTDEVLRTIDALQISDAHGVGVPCDWQPGDTCLLPHDMTDAEATSLYGTKWQKLCHYLRVMNFSN